MLLTPRLDRSSNVQTFAYFFPPISIRVDIRTVTYWFEKFSRPKRERERERKSVTAAREGNLARDRFAGLARPARYSVQTGPALIAPLELCFLEFAATSECQPSPLFGHGDASLELLPASSGLDSDTPNVLFREIHARTRAGVCGHGWSIWLPFSIGFDERFVSLCSTLRSELR